MTDLIEEFQSIRFRKIMTPAAISQEYPLSKAVASNIEKSRQTIRKIIKGQDPRLLVVVGPCSIHDCSAALEYAHLLKNLSIELAQHIFIVMRVYFEKPRTSVGWKGLIRDPRLDNSFDINYGLQRARELLLQLGELHLPAATEFLDTITPHYLNDLISWSAIGARTSESQTHRELASGLPMPVGFKNSTQGNIQIAVDAVQAAKQSQHYLSIDAKGSPAIIDTMGNPDCHIILRGSEHVTNYAAHDVTAAIHLLAKHRLLPRLMIDCSHGNSNKNHLQQLTVIKDVAEQMRQGSRGIFGIMIESNLLPGRQELAPKNKLIYGKSITDSCIGWNETEEILRLLATTQ